MIEANLRHRRHSEQHTSESYDPNRNKVNHTPKTTTTTAMKSKNHIFFFWTELHVERMRTVEARARTRSKRHRQPVRKYFVARRSLCFGSDGLEQLEMLAFSVEISSHTLTHAPSNDINDFGNGLMAGGEQKC